MVPFETTPPATPAAPPRWRRIFMHVHIVMCAMCDVCMLPLHPPPSSRRRAVSFSGPLNPPIHMKTRKPHTHTTGRHLPPQRRHTPPPTHPTTPHPAPPRALPPLPPFLLFPLPRPPRSSVLLPPAAALPMTAPARLPQPRVRPGAQAAGPPGRRRRGGGAPGLCAGRP